MFRMTWRVVVFALMCANVFLQPKRVSGGAVGGGAFGPGGNAGIAGNTGIDFGGGAVGGGGGGGSYGGSGGFIGDEGDGGIGSILLNIPGTPGQDYPALEGVPETGFTCAGQIPGYYADTSSQVGCQVFHICEQGARMHSFLCPLGTIFNQNYFVCDWWYNVDCSLAPQFYNLNALIGQFPGGGFGGGVGGGGSYDGSPGIAGNLAGGNFGSNYGRSDAPGNNLSGIPGRSGGVSSGLRDSTGDYN